MSTVTAMPTYFATCQINTTHKSYPCVVGKNGVAVDKKEGDGATPVGSFQIRQVFYRPDKLNKTDIARILTLKEKGIPVHALTTDDGWSDDVRSADYNQKISIREYLKTNAAPPLSYEKLWRDDDVYDVIVVLGYNDRPVVKNKGSAIFMHIERQSPAGIAQPTAGCIALKLPNLLDVLAATTSQTYVKVAAQGNEILIRTPS